jgi:hypothetical protein
MKKIILFFCFLLSIASNAQVTIKQNKQDNDLKLSALPYYSFGKGINYFSRQFIPMIFVSECKMSYLSENEGEDGAYDDKSDALRLRFDGYVGSLQILYASNYHLPLAMWVKFKKEKILLLGMQ